MRPFRASARCVMIAAALVVGAAGCSADSPGREPRVGQADDPFGPGATIVGDWKVPDESRLLGVAFPRFYGADEFLDRATADWSAYFEITTEPLDFLDDVTAQFNARSSGRSSFSCQRNGDSQECHMTAGSHLEAGTPAGVGIAASASVMELAVGYDCDDCESPPRSAAIMTIWDPAIDEIDASFFPRLAPPPDLAPETFWPEAGSELVPGLFARGGGLWVPTGLVPVGPVFSAVGGTGDFNAVFTVVGEPDSVWDDIERALAAPFGGRRRPGFEVEVTPTLTVRRSLGYGEPGGYTIDATMVYDFEQDVGYVAFAAIND